jgi:hypothetical protein
MTLPRAATLKLTYANVTATVALFVALGGTSYAALTLPRDSVGSKQIRARAVGASELRSRAVSSRHVRDRAISLRDISPAARTALRGARGPAGAQGAQGPAGPGAAPYRAAVNSAGERISGNSSGVFHVGGTNEYRVSFDRDMTSCVYTATLASLLTGTTLEQAPAGRVTVAADGPRILVKTYDAAGNPGPIGFHLLAAC